MTTESSISSMSDEDLQARLNELHAQKDELLAEITACSEEQAERATALADAAVVAGLPSSVRDLMAAGPLPEHIRNALVEAQAAQANGSGTEAEAEQTEETT